MPYVALDIETTGTHPKNDRIVALAITRLNHRFEEQESFTQRFYPGRPISPKATARHGITNDDVKDMPQFSSVARRVRNLIVPHVVIGYNVQFDLTVLHHEFLRASVGGMPALETLDPYLIFCQQHPRTLSAASQLCCGTPHPAPHDPAADVRTTLQVLRAQLNPVAPAEADLVSATALRKWWNFPAPHEVRSVPA